MPTISVHDWHEAAFLNTPDALILEAARAEGLVLVTYDQRTIMDTLRHWGAAGIDHAGVLFIDDLTIKPDDFGSLVRALAAHWHEEGEWEWTNRVTFLRPPASYR